MDGLVIREASAADAKRVAEIIAGEPGREAVGIAGDAERARRFGMGRALLSTDAPSWQGTIVAERDGEVVGVLQPGLRAEAMKVTLGLVWLALRVFGPLGIVRAWPRGQARRRVQIGAPQDAYHIGELDVDPRCRNQGIGGALLDHAESDARKHGYKRMSLVTTTVNPARRLYERHGFEVKETRTDPDYERYTGIEGRLLMTKELG